MKLLNPLQTKSLILFVMIALQTTYIFAEESHLQFKSNFDNTAVTRDRITKPVLSGTDNTTGYTWPNDLPGDTSRHWFNYVMGDYSNWKNYVESEVLTTDGPDGNPTKALYLEFKKDDKSFVSYSRSQYIMHAKPGTDQLQNLNKMYWKFKMRMHPKNTMDWWLPLEWKMNGETSRVGLYISGLDTSKPYWKLKHQKGTSGVKGNQWIETSETAVPSPGEWFELECYWYSSNKSDGFWRIAVNGEEIISHYGPNRLSTDDSNRYMYIMPFKVYGSAGSIWYSDFEIWDNPPSSSVLSNNYNPDTPPIEKEKPVIKKGPFIMDSKNGEFN